MLFYLYLIVNQLQGLTICSPEKQFGCCVWEIIERRMKGGGGGGDQGMGGDGMQCIDHPFRSNPGGICAFCLQEKLGKLVSSSFPLPIQPPPPPSSSSSSPSFRSDLAPSSSSTTLTLPSSSLTATSAPSSSSSSSLPINNHNHTHTHTHTHNHNHTRFHHYYSRRTRLPFLLPKKNNTTTSKSTSSASDIVLKRSKSTATPLRNHHSLVASDLDVDNIVIEDFSPRKRNGFWSFLYLSSKSSKKLNSKTFRDINNNIINTPTVSTLNTSLGTSSIKLKDKCCSRSSLVLEQDNNNNINSPNTHTPASSSSSFERKVSRSRSVGCGSRSFSGDFFERISTGFGDCTLRRVESQREGKPKSVAGGAGASSVSRVGDHHHHHHHHHHHCMKERVRCGGLFSGFMMTSSSSSSSSSSYWVSSSADDAVNGKSATVALSHNRGRSWGWAFASPMRAFSGKPSSKDSNRRDIIRDANDKNATPNLSAIPSLLAVSG